MNDRDGHTYFYDVNALSNFVTDAEHLLGFNPDEKLVDFIADQMAALSSDLETGRVVAQNKI